MISMLVLMTAVLVVLRLIFMVKLLLTNMLVMGTIILIRMSMVRQVSATIMMAMLLR